MAIMFGNYEIEDDFLIKKVPAYGEYRGLGGNDTYIVQTGLTNNVKISDGVDVDTVILGNASIKSAAFFTGGAKFTYTEGGELTVLGTMANFKFVFGGGENVMDPTSGGTTKSFSETVQAFGLDFTTLTSKAQLSPIQNATINDDGTVTGGGTNPTYTLTSKSTSIDEGSQATFNLVTTNVVDGTTLHYTLTGVQATDILDINSDNDNNPLTGTVTVSNNAGIFNIALAADNLTEGNETMTATLNGKSASTIINDTSIAGKVEYIIDGKGTLQMPQTIDAATQDYKFVDNFDLIQNVIIQHFSQGDQIQISNALGAHYNFTNEGSNIVLTYNFETDINIGTATEPVFVPKVAMITLENAISNPDDLITDEVSLETILGFDAIIDVSASSSANVGILGFHTDTDIII